MRRRDAIPAILLGMRAVRLVAATPKRAALGAHMNGAQGAALLLDVRTHATLGVHNPDIASAMPGPPGSTIKPFALSALIRRGRLSARDSFVCPGELTIAGRRLNCSHPPMAEAMRVDTAIAYSCNCFTAHFATRLQPGELAADLDRAGAGSSNGHIEAAHTPDTIRLQALGEDSVRLTLMGLATAYRSLALRVDPPVLMGLQGAVEYGTAQLSAVPGIKVAGKTGSVGTGDKRLAWFAGFAPSHSPEVVCAVMLHGQSGGGDAAPIAGRILTAWHGGRL